VTNIRTASRSAEGAQTRTETSPQDSDTSLPEVSRRVVVVGACAVGVAAALGGCGTYGGSAEGADPPAKDPAPGAALAKTADIPVGGGKVFPDQKVVVTQPEEGTFKGFTSTCTHQGCQVAEVKDGTINCPCHGSKFKVADGSVAGGPAPSPLPAKDLKVTGDAITLA